MSIHNERPVVLDELLPHISGEDIATAQLDDTVEDVAEEIDLAYQEEMSENTLSYYMQRIAGSKPLSKEEEQALGKRINSGDQSAFEELVTANLKFVIKVAYKFKNSGLPMSDIINQGNLGLLEAAKRYDYEKGVKFISYAVWWIRQYIVQGIAEQSGTVKLPIKQAGNLFKINFAKEKLLHETGQEPSIEELATYLEMKPSDVEDIVRVSKSSLSLESSLKDGDDRTFVEYLESKELSVEDQLMQQNLQNVLEEMISELDVREKEIINIRFGFIEDDSSTLDELGKKFGVSRERVRQLESRALAKLKKKATKKGLGHYLAS